MASCGGHARVVRSRRLVVSQAVRAARAAVARLIHCRKEVDVAVRILRLAGPAVVGVIACGRKATGTGMAPRTLGIVAFWPGTERAAGQEGLAAAAMPG
jgi:hypothetical protein